MKIHEYQAKEVLARYGVAVPPGRVAETREAAEKIAAELGGGRCVVKAQIHAGGRGKGGGVRVVEGTDGVAQAAGDILGMQLVTHQTGPEGRRVEKVLVEAACEIDRELYSGVVVDRERGLPVLMVSAEGGVEIEEVAARSPEKILKKPVDPDRGLEPYAARVLAKNLGLPSAAVPKAAAFLVALVRAFLDEDCSLLEVNPTVLTGDGEVLALDAKLNFDSNALFRHRANLELRDRAEEDPAELRAAEAGLSYIRLDGNIGCMVNGAGLAMATMDIIKAYGGEPANFLDVGGGAETEAVAEAFAIILEDPSVKAILVNIFGGIMRCDVIANGVVAAAKNTELTVPLVVRLEGTNVQEGRRILAESGLNLIAARDLADAAEKVVQAAGLRGGKS